MASLDPADATDALDVLADVPDWRLPAAHWDDVAELLRAMTEAPTPAAFAEATAGLELISPRWSALRNG